MANVYNGDLVAHDLRFAIVIGRFNEFISSKLLNGCIDTLTRHGVKDNDIDIFWTPGSFEIPLVAQKLAHLNKYNAIICLGAIIRGSTPHFDYVAAELSKGIANVMLQNSLPVIFGVITTENIEQAIERAGTKSGNKGSDAALAAIEMANLTNKIATLNTYPDTTLQGSITNTPISTTDLPFS